MNGKVKISDSLMYTARIMTAKIMKPNAKALQEAAELLRKNDVVGMPTETVYGLAGNAFSEDALLRIYKTKERPTFDPLIIHIAPDESGDILTGLETQGLILTDKLGNTARERIRQLTDRFWPGPLTLVLPKDPKVPDLATSGLPTVAIRMPSHPVARSLLKAANMPLAAPSANRFGRISPTSAQDVIDELGTLIELVLDGGSCEIGLESTVLSIDPEGNMTLLRPGYVTAEAITECTGVSPAAPNASAAPKTAQNAPGMLASHYAPAKKLILLSEPVTQIVKMNQNSLEGIKTLGLLVFGPTSEAEEKFKQLSGKQVICLSLSESGNLDEAARNLFAKMRALDESEAELLFTEPCPSAQGIGHAITDRLKRASH